MYHRSSVSKPGDAASFQITADKADFPVDRESFSISELMV
jgi:hypothetical protein